jgi:cytoskeletal protein RodZ
MQSFGGYLKEQRESKNVSLKDIARSTNITERYLDLIEKNEFESVPGGAYIRGYISSYASFIGIDTHKTIERFDSYRKEKYDAEHNQAETSRDKVKRNPVMFLSNKGKWVILTRQLNRISIGHMQFLDA